MPQKKRQGLKPAAQEQPEPQAAKETAAQNAAELPPVFPDASPLPLAPELPHRQDTATAERVMERIDAAQTRKASQKGSAESTARRYGKREIFPLAVYRGRIKHAGA